MADSDIEMNVPSTSTSSNIQLASTDISNSNCDLSENEKNPVSVLNSESENSPTLIKNEGFIIGDVVWAKVGKYPFWPSIVCIDPDTNSYLKESGTIKKTYSVHVRFYGDNGRRSWVKTIEHYCEKNDLLKKHPSSSLRFVTKNKKQINLWNVAITLADKWSKLNREERLSIFCMVYNISNLTPDLPLPSLPVKQPPAQPVKQAPAQPVEPAVPEKPSESVDIEMEYDDDHPISLKRKYLEEQNKKGKKKSRAPRTKNLTISNKKKGTVLKKKGKKPKTFLETYEFFSPFTYSSEDTDGSSADEELLVPFNPSRQVSDDLKYGVENIESVNIEKKLIKRAKSNTLRLINN